MLKNLLFSPYTALVQLGSICPDNETSILGLDTRKNTGLALIFRITRPWCTLNIISPKLKIINTLLRRKQFTPSLIKKQSVTNWGMTLLSVNLMSLQIDFDITEVSKMFFWYRLCRHLVNRSRPYGVRSPMQNPNWRFLLKLEILDRAHFFDIDKIQLQFSFQLIGLWSFKSFEQLPSNC